MIGLNMRVSGDGRTVGSGMRVGAEIDFVFCHCKEETVTVDANKMMTSVILMREISGDDEGRDSLGRGSRGHRMNGDSSDDVDARLHCLSDFDDGDDGDASSSLFPSISAPPVLPT